MLALSLQEQTNHTRLLKTAVKKTVLVTDMMPRMDSTSLS